VPLLGEKGKKLKGDLIFLAYTSNFGFIFLSNPLSHFEKKYPP